MLEKYLNNYVYADKQFAIKVADGIISVTTYAFGWGKTVEYNSPNKTYRVKDEVAVRLFYRILTVPVAILLLPITFIACIIKSCDSKNTAIHNGFNPQDECPICLEPLDEQITTTLKCNHLFHKVCIDTWLRESAICPLCRAPHISISQGGNRSDPVIRRLTSLPMPPSFSFTQPSSYSNDNDYKDYTVRRDLASIFFSSGQPISNFMDSLVDNWQTQSSLFEDADLDFKESKYSNWYL